MHARLWKLVPAAFLLALPVIAACGSSGGGSGHTAQLGGVGHRDGYVDPMSNCTGCHGAALQGGKGPNCYACHNSNDHTTVRGGVPHNQPGVDCARCHGPSRTQRGLGPACVQAGCHAS